MRVLMISDFYPPVLGGLERHVQTLSRELVRRGHSVAVATLWQDRAPCFELDQGVRVHRVSGWSRALLPLYNSPDHHFHPTAPDPGVMRALRRIVVQEQPDIVHARGWMLYSFLPLKAMSGAKLIVTLHDYSLVCPKKTYFQADRICDGPGYVRCVRCATDLYGTVKALALTTGLQMSKRMHGRVDKYLAISGAVRAASARATGSPQQVIEVVPTFIPDAAVLESEHGMRPTFLPPTDGYILFVGALSRHKGLHVLLDAYRRLQTQVPLVIIGIDRGATQFDLPPGAILARNVPHQEVMRAWAHAAFGVVPSLWPEPFGQVAIEAMATGRAVIASNVGGLADAVVDGETGLLVAPGAPDELCRAMETLLADPALCSRLGAGGRMRASRFLASSVITRIEQIYGEVLAGRPAPAYVVAQRSP
jgi:glycosyltransferase involved in cell wall biosynthesis